MRGVPGVPPVGAHKPRRARRAVRPGARGNCPGARRRACRRRARAAARQHLANEAGGEAAPAARQLVAGQLRARHADGVVVISLCPLLEPRTLTQTCNRRQEMRCIDRSIGEASRCCLCLPPDALRVMWAHAQMCRASVRSAVRLLWSACSGAKNECVPPSHFIWGDRLYPSRSGGVRPSTVMACALKTR